MFKTIMFTEIRSRLGTVTFSLWLGVSCLVVWMALESGYSRYEHKHQQYLDLKRAAQDGLSKAYMPVVAEEDIFRVLRELSVLSAIVYGLEGEMPVYMSVNPNGVQPGAGIADKSLLDLLGELDFLLVIELILGLMAVVQAATLVSSEEGNGTLKLMLANPVSRSTVLLGKGLGAFAVIAFTLLFSTLFGLFLLSVRGFPLFEAAVLAPILLILTGSLVYLLVIFLIGLTCSILFLNSQVALILSVSLWAALSFLVPQSAWTTAELIRPAENERTVYVRQKYAREAHLNAYHEELNKRYPHLQPDAEGNADWSGVNQTELTKDAVAVWAKYSDRIAKEVTTIAENYHRNKQAQEALGRVLSRVSPTGSFRLLLANLAGTGNQVRWKFLQAAWDYQNMANDKVFSKDPMITIGPSSWWPSIMRGADNPPPPPPPPPVMVPSLGSVLTESALDMAMLFIYAVVLFMLAYSLFMRRSIV